MNKVINFLASRRRFFSFSLLRVASMVLGLASNIFIVRKLSVEDFGIFSVALLVVNLITTFGFSWSSSSILTMVVVKKKSMEVSIKPFGLET